jgi:hypothetical protein
MDNTLPQQLSKFLKKDDLELLERLGTEPNTTRQEILNFQLAAASSLFNLMHEKARLCDTGHPEGMALAVRLAIQLQDQCLSIIRTLNHLPVETVAVVQPVAATYKLRVVPPRPVMAA